MRVDVVACLMALAAVSVLAQKPAPKYPGLAGTFVAEVEANILNKNYTVYTREFFDDVQNVSRIEVMRNGSRHVRVNDFRRQASYHVDVDKTTCTSGPIKPGPAVSVGADGLAHMVGVSDFFHFGKKFHDTYEGQVRVRGILCDKWRGQYSGSQRGHTFNYSLEWFFAAQDNWTMPIGNIEPVAVPVRLVLLGTVSAAGSAQRHVHHVYDFVGFRTGAAAAAAMANMNELFEAPRGYNCKGVGVVKTLPKLPSRFSFTMSSNNGEFGHVSHRSYYGYDADRAETVSVFHFHPNNTHPYGTGSVRFLRNFREGTQYIISRHNCTLSTLQPSGISDIGEEISYLHGHASIASPNAVFGFEASRNFTYVGPRTVEGVHGETWSVLRDDVKIYPGQPAPLTLWEYTFSLPTWAFDTFRGELNSTQIPLEIRGYLADSATLISISVISNFEVGAPGEAVLDDSTCFHGKEQATLTFDLETDYDDDRELHRSLVQSLAKTMEVTVDRFAVTTYPGPSNRLTVVVRVHDVPKIGDKALLDKLTSKSSAIRRLYREIHHGDFFVSSAATGKVQAAEHSFSSSEQSTKIALYPGHIVAICLGALSLGVLFGVGGVFCVQRRLYLKIAYRRDSTI
ncbi:uncharacterized protein LOC135828925 [Sycon ciliatum]|uniref:uncharacterized protein LOC135828925 n=1 Tax=Sycon ciliatum TaxID=27933 RepID=UPI0031F71BD2